MHNPLRRIRDVRFGQTLVRFLTSLQFLALLPAIVLTGVWFGLEAAAIVASLAVPAFLFLASPQEPLGSDDGPTDQDALTGLFRQDALIAQMDRLLQGRQGFERTVTCMSLAIDDFEQLRENKGNTVADTIAQTVATRTVAALRDADVVARTGDGKFAACFGSIRNGQLEKAIQTASHLQATLAEPIQAGGRSHSICCSVGFVLSSRLPECGGGGVLRAADYALEDAQKHAPGGIRAFSPEMKSRVDAHVRLVNDAKEALESGQVHAWFQPQVSADTGEVSGFEAKARWEHPEVGPVPEPEFVAAIADAGLVVELGEILLVEALGALQKWARAGCHIPTVVVGMNAEQLSDMSFPEKVKWHMDAYDLAPERLTIQVQESLIAGDKDERSSRAITALSDFGCRLDIDEFGSGHAAIKSIQRYPISRIKIATSLVSQIDQDMDQQKLFSAVLLMAERLGIDTIADGIETLGERALLAQLGCGHLQGAGLAPPMPHEETFAWIERHRIKLSQVPQVGRSGET